MNIKKRERAERRRRGGVLRVVVVNIAVLIILAGIGEAALRVYIRAARGSLALVCDDAAGWRTKPEYRFVGQRTTAEGGEYSVVITTDEHGFRQWDRVRPGHTKVLVIGDSFTHAMNASDHNTYYAVLGRELDWDVYAYGCSGYGTAQEYLMLDRYFDMIDPDVVLLQFSSNDTVNNHYELERTQVTNGFVRPYWEDGRMVLRMPRGARWLREIGNRYSRLVYSVFFFYDKIAYKNDWAVKEKNDDKWKPEAASVTGDLLRLFRRRCGTARAVAFTVAGDREAERDNEDLLREAGFEVASGMSSLILVHDGNTKAMRVMNDAHLNENGHVTLGEGLAEWFQKN